MGRDLGRAAGYYEQCDHRGPVDGGQIPRVETFGASIAVNGLVGRSALIGHHALRQLAGSDRLSDFDTRTVSIADLLSEIRLDCDADVVTWHGVDGARVPSSIARMLDDKESVLVLGGCDENAAPRWSAPVVLRSSSLPDPGQMEVVALTAMTFAEFIGADR